MKTRVLISAFALSFICTNFSGKAQFQIIAPPCNASGFKTVCSGNSTFQNKIIIHEPGYPAYISLNGGLSWEEPMSRGPNQSLPTNCNFLPDDCYNRIDLKLNYVNIPPGTCANNYVMAVGKHNKLIHSINNGISWTDLPLSPNIQIPVGSEFIDCAANGDWCKISCAVTKTGYAIFWDGNCSCNPYVFGQTNLNSNINAVFCSNYQYPSFCGENGKLFLPSSFTANPVYSEIPTGTQENLFSGYAFESDIFVCGTKGTIIRIFYQNGAWNQTLMNLSNLFPSGKYPDFYSIAVAPLSRGGGIYVVGDQGTLLKSLDHGNTWSLENTGVTQTLYDISINETAIYIVGYNSTILKKRNCLPASKLQNLGL
jgi:hypothetical protein